MEPLPRRFVLLETESGKRVLLPACRSGAAGVAGAAAPGRSAARGAKVLRSVDCRRSRRTLRDVQRRLSELSCLPVQLSSRAEALYGFLNCVPGSLAPPAADRSVAFGDDARIAAQFRRDGYVVVRDVFGEGLVDAAVDELWESPRLLGRSPAIRRGDPRTWGTDWPQQDGGKNFLESTDPYADEGCWRLAQSQEAIHVLKLLWGQHGVEDLVLREAPRWGLMRPTAVDRRWGTLESWLHWDQNPWREPGFSRVQAFACLSAQTESSGGLLCVPGFHERWGRWGLDNPEECFRSLGVDTQGKGDGDPLEVPELDPLRQEVVKVLAPKGALVLWDGRLPHQNFANTGADFRVVLYLDLRPGGARPGRPELEAREGRRLLARRALGREEGFWPAGLSALGRSVCCAPEAADAGRGTCVESPLAEALRLTAAACELERRGSAATDPDERRRLFDGSMELHVRAEKVFPDIARWMDFAC